LFIVADDVFFHVVAFLRYDSYMTTDDIDVVEAFFVEKYDMPVLVGMRQNWLYVEVLDTLELMANSHFFGLLQHFHTQ
jgi:hypothetical protein